MSLNEMKKFRFGILGCGMIAGVHAAAIQSLNEAELAGAADFNQEAAKRFCEKYGAHAYENEADMLAAAKQISEKYHCAVLCKGGHSINDANDLLYLDGNYRWFYGKRIDNPNTHGTGCTLSSAIASNLAKGFNLAESVQCAKEYISYILSAQLDLGQGSGPMQHSFGLSGKFAEEKRGQL